MSGLGNLSVGNSVLASAASNSPSDQGDKKCPCCGGNTNDDTRVCRQCKEDAGYNPGSDFAMKVRHIESRLR